MRRNLLITQIALLTICVSANAQDAQPVGTLHRIDLQAEHPRAYHPEPGDLIQCYLDYTVVPGQIVTKLIVELEEGKSVKPLGVFHTGQPKVAGASQISAFLTVPSEGLSYVLVTPVRDDGSVPTKPYRLAFLVNRPAE